MKILCVGRGYIGTALAEHYGFTAISHQLFLENPELLIDTDAVVNTAGIVGHGKCDEAGYDEVIKANVDFALTLQTETLKRGGHFIQLSTIGISEKQVAPSISRHDSKLPFTVREGTFVFPHNLYCASKILNESVVSRRQHTILRLPWVLVGGVFESRLQNWKSVQDTWCSVLGVEHLIKVIKHVAYYKTTGTYHVADRHVYFPEFIKQQLGKHLPIRADYPKNMTAAVPVDTCSIERILGEA